MKKTTKSSAKTAKPARLKKASTKSPLKKSANRLTKSVTTTKKAPVAKKMLSKVRPALKTPVAKKTIIKKYVKPSSQYDMVLKHLMKKGSINVLEAIELYGVLRLGAKKMLSKVRPALKTPVAKKTIIKKYVKPSSQYDMENLVLHIF